MKPKHWYADRIDPIGSMVLYAGQTVYVDANQAWREGEVLATIKDEALIEYQMPNGSSTMWVVKRVPPYQRTRNISYYNVPKKWLKELVDTSVDWIGCPQQLNPKKGMPLSPEEYLAQGV